MSLGRAWCTVVSLPSSILVVGGYFGGGITNTTEALSLQTMTFAPGPAMLTARSECAVLALPQDQSPRHALVVGGRFQSNISSTEVLTTTD